MVRTKFSTFSDFPDSVQYWAPGGSRGMAEHGITRRDLEGSYCDSSIDSTICDTLTLLIMNRTSLQLAASWIYTECTSVVDRKQLSSL